MIQTPELALVWLQNNLSRLWFANRLITNATRAVFLKEGDLTHGCSFAGYLLATVKCCVGLNGNQSVITIRDADDWMRQRWCNSLGEAESIFDTLFSEDQTYDLSLEHKLNQYLFD